MMISRPMRRLHFSPWPIALALAAIALAAAVFAVTQSVQQREARVADLNRKLLSEQQTIRVLDAEWAYLTRPQRLEELMVLKTQRDVMPPTPAPIATIMPEDIKIEPAAGIVEKPLEAPKKKVVAVKKESKPVKKTIAAKSKEKQTKTASLDGAWPIKRKTPPARPTIQPAKYPARAGVARPIVE